MKEYYELVADIKEQYSQPVQGGCYIKKNNITGENESVPFYLKWVDECEEVNLWTYWQGRKNKKAKILLVGQDWACPWDEKTGKLVDYVQDAIDAVDASGSARYIDGVRNNSFPTDVMLRELLISLGKEYDPFTPDNVNLFFTNLCCGYRDFGASGGLDKKVLIYDAQYTRRLIDIVEPDIVICLGKDTYEALVKATKSVPVTKEKSFYKKLSAGECYAMYNGRTPIFGQAHTGSLGVINRWRYNPDKLEYSSETVKELLLNDWATMKKFLK